MKLIGLLGVISALSVGANAYCVKFFDDIAMRGKSVEVSSSRLEACTPLPNDFNLSVQSWYSNNSHGGNGNVTVFDNVECTGDPILNIWLGDHNGNSGPLNVKAIKAIGDPNILVGNQCTCPREFARDCAMNQ